jgi:hypothetical protein
MTVRGQHLPLEKVDTGREAFSFRSDCIGSGLLVYGESVFNTSGRNQYQLGSFRVDSRIKP